MQMNWLSITRSLDPSLSQNNSALNQFNFTVHLIFSLKLNSESIREFFKIRELYGMNASPTPPLLPYITDCTAKYMLDNSHLGDSPQL